jgi:hypothetical protein
VVITFLVVTAISETSGFESKGGLPRTGESVIARLFTGRSHHGQMIGTPCEYEHCLRSDGHKPVLLDLKEAQHRATETIYHSRWIVRYPEL